MEDFKPIPVDSTALRSIGPYVNGSLTVTWKSGNLSTFHAVPERLWHELQASTSKGRFVNSHLKGRFKES
jgi:hypothetical protein